MAWDISLCHGSFSWWQPAIVRISWRQHHGIQKGRDDPARNRDVHQPILGYLPLKCWDFTKQNDGSIWAQVKMTGPTHRSSSVISVGVLTCDGWRPTQFEDFFCCIKEVDSGNQSSFHIEITTGWLAMIISPYLTHIWGIRWEWNQPTTSHTKNLRPRFYPNSRVSITATCDTWWPQSWCWCPVSRFCWASTTCNWPQLGGITGGIHGRVVMFFGLPFLT